MKSETNDPSQSQSVDVYCVPIKGIQKYVMFPSNAKTYGHI